MREDLLAGALQRRDNDPSFAVFDFIADRKDQIVKTMSESIRQQNEDISLASSEMVAEIALQMHVIYHRLIGSTPNEAAALKMKKEAEDIAGIEITDASIEQAEVAIDQLLIDITNGKTE